jgi:hypothetical protein
MNRRFDAEGAGGFKPVSGLPVPVIAPDGTLTISSKAGRI